MSCVELRGQPPFAWGRDLDELDLEEMIIRVTKEIDNTNYLGRAQKMGRAVSGVGTPGFCFIVPPILPQKNYV